MSNPKLSSLVAPNQSLIGAQDGPFAPAGVGTYMPAGPTIERGRGCWNCLHWDADKGKAHWNQRRQGLLALALQHKQEGRQDKAKGLALMIDKVDASVGRSTFGLCSKGHTTPDCADPVPLIHYQHLCHMWDGADGSSLATQGHKIDLLPEELREEFLPKVDPKRLAAAKAEAAGARAVQEPILDTSTATNIVTTSEA